MATRARYGHSVRVKASGRAVAYEAAYISRYPALPEDWLGAVLDWARPRRDEYGGRLLVVAPSVSHFVDTALCWLSRSISQQTTRTLGSAVPPVVIACWPNVVMLDKIEAATGLKALAVLPWDEDEIAAWRAARSAADILGEGAAPDPPT
jgi:hypothetical protein